MPDERYTFETARIRLEEIAAEVRKKDTSLEKSLDLLEEGVRLANICTELVDHTDLSATVTQEVPELLAGELAEDDRSAGEPTGATSEEEAASDDRGAGEESGSADTGEESAPDAEEGEPEAEVEAEADDVGTEPAADDGEADAEADLDSGSFDDTEDDLHEPA